MNRTTRIGQNTPDDLQRVSRARMLLPAVLMLASLSMHGATMDGFVTKIDSQHSFNIGKMLVTTNSQTACSSRKVTRIRVEPASWSGGRPRISYLPIGLIARLRHDTAVPCEMARIPVGTRVRALGDFQAAGRVGAKRLLIYSVQPRPTGSKSVAANPIASSNQAEALSGANAEPGGPHDRDTIPATISFGYGKPLLVIRSRPVQEFVTEIGMGLLRQSQPGLANVGGSKIALRFYVVRSSQAISMRKFATVDGRLPYYWGNGEYKYKRLNFYELATDNAIATQNGLILVPDQVLSRLHNQAELSALLSYSIASVLRDDVLKSAVAVESTDRYDELHRFHEMLQINQQVLAVGVRQMYLAGYDIREAPYAWAVAQGKPVNNPVIDSRNPNEEIPWYAAYAFNYISQYYKDVDYSKLKRGEKEYQQFLAELRKADPGAFAPEKADSRHAEKER